MPKKKIYGFFNCNNPNGHPPRHEDLGFGLCRVLESGGAEGIAITEDGEFASTHFSSNEEWSQRDLAHECHHKDYDKVCPDGWEFEFVTIAQRINHPQFLEALDKYLQTSE